MTDPRQLPDGSWIVQDEDAAYYGESEEEARERATIGRAATAMLAALREAETALAIVGSYRTPDQARAYAALTNVRTAIAFARGTAEVSA